MEGYCNIMVLIAVAGVVNNCLKVILLVLIEWSIGTEILDT